MSVRELPTYMHRTGCPAALDPDRAHRIETFEAKRPKGGGTVRVTRCGDCGEALYENVEDTDDREEPNA